MRSAGPKSRSHRRRWCTAVAVVSCATWAFWPVEVPEVTVEPFRDPPVSGPTSTVALDLAAFRAPLWFAPPPPPPPAATPSSAVAAAELQPLPPLKLQLIAITTEGAGETLVRAAIFYDPDQDRLVTVKPGDTLEGRTVEAITAAAVECREPRGLRTQTIALVVVTPLGGNGGHR